MTVSYITEPLFAVLPLNFILTIYLHVVYARSETFNKTFLYLNYVLSAGVLIEVFFQSAVNGSLPLFPSVTLFLSYLRQASLMLVCASFAEYVVLPEETTTDHRLKITGHVLLGVFFYLQLVTCFAGANARIADGRIVYGLGRTLFSFAFPLALVLLAVVTVFLQRKRMEPYRLRVIFAVMVFSVAAFVVRYYVFPEYLLDFFIASIDAYIFCFALETPAYAQTEQALARLADAQREAEEAEKRAKKADEEMGEFLATMSHEIRTPLTTILGMNETILRTHEEGPICEHARDIESAGNSLIQIINDILDFSKIESGELELLIRDYHLGQVLHDVDNMIRIRAAQNGLGFISQIDRSLPEELSGDRIRIQQVMVNLLNNAVKYTKKGHVKLQLSGERGNDPSYITLHITVSDTGIGIREEDLPKLFTSFQRIDMEQTHAIEGTGLGLAITGRLITLMDGTVDVQSVYGQGSTFHVAIPQRVTGVKTIKDYEEETTHAQTKKHSSFTAPDMRVLIVDDNRMNRLVLESLLADTKVQTAQVDSGEAALALCRKETFDLILMDYMMPNMDGVETLHALRNDPETKCAAAKVVVCTANAVVGVRARLMQEGFDDFLSKPVSSDELKELLEKFADR